MLAESSQLPNSFVTFLVLHKLAPCDSACHRHVLPSFCSQVSDARQPGLTGDTTMLYNPLPTILQVKDDGAVTVAKDAEICRMQAHAAFHEDWL